MVVTKYETIYKIWTYWFLSFICHLFFCILWLPYNRESYPKNCVQIREDMKILIIPFRKSMKISKIFKNVTITKYETIYDIWIYLVLYFVFQIFFCISRFSQHRKHLLKKSFDRFLEHFVPHAYERWLFFILVWFFGKTLYRM